MRTSVKNHKIESSDFSCDIEQFLELEAQQIAEQVPLLLVWFSYYNPDFKTRITYQYKADFRSKFSIDLEYIRSEAWLEKLSLLLLKVSPVEIMGALSYVCPLMNKSSGLEYLLIFPSDSLSVFQQQFIENHSQIIKNHLSIYQLYNQQQDEVQALENLIQQISHKFRTPLAQLNILAESLRLTLPEGSCQEQAALMQKTVNQLNTCLTDLIDCSQKTKLKIGIYDLQSILTETIQNLQYLIAAKRLKVQHSKQEALITVDYSQVKQVFENLLSNAIHFSPDEGVITCNWQIFQEEITISIADQGQGLSDEDLQNIFTPFYSRRSGGTGLGLTIAKKIIVDHRGSIWASNTHKGGALFTFTLPRYQFSD